MPQAIPERIPCESVQEFEQELGSLREALSFQETEETWERIARALIRFGAIVKGGGYKFEKELVNGLKASHKPIASSMHSERTRLSAAALECIGIIAPRIGPAFNALVPLFVPHILRLATRSNKVYVTRSQNTMGLILAYCQIPSIVPHLLVACKESKIVTGRAVALEGVLRCLNKWDWAQQDFKAKVGDVEEIIRITGRDKDAGIRQTSRKVFEAYKILFPERVEEFTGPLTPVMRKYLDIQPPPRGNKPIERVRLQSEAEKPRRNPIKGNLAASTSSVPSTKDKTRTNSRAHIRSTSPNAVTGTSSKTPISNSPDAVSDSRTMPPPAAIPAHARNPARPQAEARPGHLQEGNVRYERQRVVSTASSTHSTQSAPANSHSTHDHRPPVRLATSQTNSSRTNPVVAGSSGKARRVRKEVPVEPHSSNLRDPLTMAHRAPTRTMKGPARQPTQNSSSNALGVVFPTSESGVAQTQRKGAQRVPKPAPTASVSPPITSAKNERPATVMGVVSKGEVKPSIFRRGVARVPGGGAKETQKKKQDGFAPRRGGVAQPTLSQLSKQKTQNSVSGATSHLPKSRAPAPDPAPANRPAWGVGLSKTGTTKILPVLRGQGGVSRAQTPKLAEDAQADPVTIPLPVSPGRDKEDTMAQMVPLQKSPRTETSNNEPTEKVPLQETGIAEDALAAFEVNERKEVIFEVPLQETEIVEDAQTAVEVNEPKEAVLEEMHAEDEIVDSLDEHEDEVHANIGEPAVIVQEEVTNGDAALTVARMVSPRGPGTPPFPITDGESDEDELEGIEFTSGDVYTPGGMPIKTTHKLAVLETTNLTERSPLGNVVLNA